MKTKLMLLMLALCYAMFSQQSKPKQKRANTGESEVSGQTAIEQSEAWTFHCSSGSTEPEWNQHYPYPTGLGFFAGEKETVYRRYLPNPNEVRVAKRKCTAALEAYVHAMEDSFERDAFRPAGLKAATVRDLDSITHCLANRRCADWLGWNKLASGAYQAVFVYDGWRYTWRWDGKSRSAGGKLEVWFHWNNTLGRNPTEHVGDIDLDAKVNFGNYGESRWIFNDSPSQPKKGLDWKPAWQYRFDAAVMDFAAFKAGTHNETRSSNQR